MKKNIALVTLQDRGNIGNRLQNFALQTVLEKYGCTVYNFDNLSGIPARLTLKECCKIYIKGMLGIWGNEYYAKQYGAYRNMPLRRETIACFNTAYIHNIVYTAWDGGILPSPSDNNVLHPNLPDEIDLGIVGSDQVWHRWKEGTVSREEELRYYYLDYLAPEKRAAYAASFGFTAIPSDSMELHKQGLKGMQYISCRELSGCSLVKETVGRTVPHVLDPTLLLDAAAWRNLSGNAEESFREIGKEPYIFVYFLGSIPEEYHQAIGKERDGIKVVDFNDYQNIKMVTAGPLEFLYLVEHAYKVYTDSFHCVVYSIIFHRSFLAFPRMEKGFSDMYGRIEELLLSTGNTGSSYTPIDSHCKADDMATLLRRSREYIEMILEA